MFYYRMLFIVLLIESVCEAQPIFTDPLLKLEGHSQHVRDIAVSPNGKLVLTGSSDRTACLWNAETGDLLKRIECPGVVHYVEFSPDGLEFIIAIADYASTSQYCGVWECDVETQLTVNRFDFPAPFTFAFGTYSKDGTKIITANIVPIEGRFASSSFEFIFWDRMTGERLNSFIYDGALLDDHLFIIPTDIQFSPTDSKVLIAFYGEAVGSPWGTTVRRSCELWDSDDWSYLSTTPMFGSTAFSANGMTYFGVLSTWYTGEYWNYIAECDTATGKILRRLTSFVADTIVLSPSKKYLIANYNETVKLIEKRNFKTIAQFNQFSPWTKAFFPDASKFVVAGSSEGNVWIWDISSLVESGVEDGWTEY